MSADPVEQAAASLTIRLHTLGGALLELEIHVTNLMNTPSVVDNLCAERLKALQVLRSWARALQDCTALPPQLDCDRTFTPDLLSGIFGATADVATEFSIQED